MHNDKVWLDSKLGNQASRQHQIHCWSPQTIPEPFLLCRKRPPPSRHMSGRAKVTSTWIDPRFPRKTLPKASRCLHLLPSHSAANVWSSHWPQTINDESYQIISADFFWSDYFSFHALGYNPRLLRAHVGWTLALYVNETNKIKRNISITLNIKINECQVFC